MNVVISLCVYVVLGMVAMLTIYVHNIVLCDVMLASVCKEQFELTISCSFMYVLCYSC